MFVWLRSCLSVVLLCFALLCFALFSFVLLLFSFCRTLQEFFDGWYERYRQASIATNDRAEQIAEVAKEVEVRDHR